MTTCLCWTLLAQTIGPNNRSKLQTTHYPTCANVTTWWWNAFLFIFLSQRDATDWYCYQLPNEAPWTMVRTAPQVLVRVEVKGHHHDDDVCVMFACMAGTCLHFAMAVVVDHARRAFTNTVNREVPTPKWMEKYGCLARVMSSTSCRHAHPSNRYSS